MTMKAMWPVDVLPLDPPGMGVRVDGQRVPMSGPDPLGRLSRVDLVVREVRLVPDRQERVVALMCVPATSPVPPALTYNESVKQESIAWVTLGPGQWEVRQEHIHTEGPPPARDAAPDLAGWLLAQIAEDERVARIAKADWSRAMRASGRTRTTSSCRRRSGP